MATAIEIGLLVLGVLFGIFWFSIAILPIIYGFPRAAWWCLRKKARWRAPFAYLVAPVVWNVIFFGAAAILAVFFMPIAEFLMSSSALGAGLVGGIALAAVRAALSKSALPAGNWPFASRLRASAAVMATRAL